MQQNAPFLDTTPTPEDRTIMGELTPISRLSRQSLSLKSLVNNPDKGPIRLNPYGTISKYSQ